MINQAPPDDWDALPLNWRELMEEQAGPLVVVTKLEASRMIELIQKESAALVKNRTL